MNDFGGEGGIRTHEALVAPTRSPGERLRPLGYLSTPAYREGCYALASTRCPWSFARAIAAAPRLGKGAILCLESSSAPT